MHVICVCLRMVCPTSLDYMSNMLVSYKQQELISRRERMRSPWVFGGDRAINIFSFLYYGICCVCFRPV